MAGKSTRSDPKAPSIDPRKTLPQQVEDAAAAATWLGPSDQAAIDLAVHLARMIHAAGPDPDAAKAVAPIASTLSRLLTDLGLTSKGRPAGLDTSEGVTWLDELRERRQAATARGRTPSKDRNS